MSGRQDRNPDPCQCSGCKTHRSRQARAETARLREARAEIARLRETRVETARLWEANTKEKGVKRPEKRKNIKPRLIFVQKKTPKNEGNGQKRTPQPTPKEENNECIIKMQNPCLMAKITFRTKGFMLNQVMYDPPWKVFITCLIFLILCMWVPLARGEKSIIELPGGHNLEITKTDSALLIDSFEFQTNICSATEYFSKNPLKRIYGHVKRWKKTAIDFQKPKLARIANVKDSCPDVAKDPTIGPFPKFITHLPRKSIYLVVSFENKSEEAVKCDYSFDTDFVEKSNQIQSSLGAHKRLFARSCQKMIVNGMIFPKQYFLTHLFKIIEPANILKCSEMCVNIYEKAQFNASCETNEKFAECKPTLPRCFYWSFNIRTNFCLLYLHKDIKPNEKKISVYDKMNEASGTADYGLTGPVDCRATSQIKKLWMRVKSKEKSNEVSWAPVRGICRFIDDFDENLKVYSSCMETSALIQLSVSNQEEKLKSFKNSFKEQKDVVLSRQKRSPTMLTQALISPALHKFFLGMMTGEIPMATGFSLSVAGPLLGLFFLLTSTLVSLLVQLAEDNQQHILKSGVSELSIKNLNEISDNWDQWEGFDLVNLQGIEDTQHFNEMFPFYGLSNLSSQVSSTITTYENILKNHHPVAPKISKEIGQNPFTYIVLNTKEHIKKIYFFSRENKDSPKQQISAFMSLDKDIPLQEGVISNEGKLSSEPTFQCVDVFRRTKTLPKNCFWRNNMGSTDKNKFLIGKDKMIFKILGSRIIQINCPEISKTTFSSGIYVFVASANCKIHVGGNLYHEGNKLRSKGSFNVILDIPGNKSHLFVPMSKRLIRQIKLIHDKWGPNSVLIGILYFLWILGVIILVVYKLQRNKTRKRRCALDLKYKSPVLLPMKDLKRRKIKKDETTDAIERLSRE